MEEESEAQAAFKSVVLAFVQLHDQVAETTATLRDLKKRKNEAAAVVLEYMKVNDIEECRLTGGGKLCRRETKRLAPVKREDLLQGIKKAVGEQRAEQMMLDIYGSRQVIHSDKLKRTKPRAQR